MSNVLRHTFKKKVGEKVLPEFISVTFDPTVRQLYGFALSGAFAFDDEGVRVRAAMRLF